jgi:uncharacterized protein YggE
MDRTVTVVGSASASVDPDCARLSCGVQVIGVNAQDALRRSNEGMRAIIEALTAGGIDRRDIGTSGPNLYPMDKGYAGSNQISVLVRDVASVGEVIDAVAAAAGPNLTLHGVSFSVLDTGAHLSEVRAAAMASARTTAEELAAASGAAVGEVVTITEASGLPSPSGSARMMPSAAVMSTPVESGAQELGFSVTVTYRLLDAG